MKRKIDMKIARSYDNDLRMMLEAYCVKFIYDSAVWFTCQKPGD